jgi:NDP-sugar pyrophosphorylase family protein
MGALTAELPKPMLPIDGKPMLEYVVRRLQSAGLSEILIVVGYRRDLIEAHFGTGFSGISFAVQDVAEGTAAAVKLGRDFAASDPFLLTFGDIICEARNYAQICEMLEREKAAAVIGVKYADDPWQGAAVYANPFGGVEKILEKPPRGTSTTHWNSAGLYSFGPEIFAEIERTPKSVRGEYEITTSIAQLIEQGRPVHMFPMEGAWRDVGRPEDLAEAGQVLNDSQPGA